MSTGTTPSPRPEPHTQGQSQGNTGLSAQTQVRNSSRSVMIAGLLLIGLFFSPFVSCADARLSGAEAFQQSLTIQEEMAADGIYVSGISLILFPIAGVIGLLAGVQALSDLARGQSVRRQGSFALLAALATGWPIFEAVRVVMRSEGIWKLEWGFFASVLAAIGMLIASLGMRKDPNP